MRWPRGCRGAAVGLVFVRSGDCRLHVGRFQAVHGHHVFAAVDIYAKCFCAASYDKVRATVRALERRAVAVPAHKNMRGRGEVARDVGDGAGDPRWVVNVANEAP